MKIEGKGIGKRYGAQWIFRDLNLEAEAPDVVAVTGANGAGKSTLLQIISGRITPLEGSIIYHLDGKTLSQDDIAPMISFSAPYLDLPEELSLMELLELHFAMRSPLEGLNVSDLPKILEVKPDQILRQMSSGMKQRIKLGLAFFSKSSLLILDEPTSNFDRKWKDWYLQLKQDKSLMQGRLLVIGSNEEEEYLGATRHIQLSAV